MKQELLGGWSNGERWSKRKWRIQMHF